jgi:thiol-disulfide isomerase/thioredoxin
LICSGVVFTPLDALAGLATELLDSPPVKPAPGKLATETIGQAIDRFAGRSQNRLPEPDLAKAPKPEPGPEAGHDADKDGHWEGDGHNHDSQLTGSAVRVNRVSELKDQVVAGINTNSRDLKELLLPGTIVHFWASWCGPCAEEFPELEHFYSTRLSQKLAAKGIRLITISNDFAVAPAARFMEKHGTTFPVYLDTEQTINLALVGQRALPSTVMIDASGRFHRLALGKLDWNFPRLLDVLETTAARKPGAGNRKKPVNEDE